MIDIIVIGAGAAGMMAAGTAAMCGKSVAVLEKNKINGKKLLITGKGRCNVTNNSDINNHIANIPTNGNFLYSAYSQFSAFDTIDFFEKLGVPLKTERGNRVFPVSDKSQDIVNSLVKFCEKAGVKFYEGRAKSIISQNGSYTVLYDEAELKSKSVIIATGGKSYPKTGSTGDGYILAEAAGHTIIPCKPSLVPLEISDSFCKNMQGLSLKNVMLKIHEKVSGIEVYSQMGEMLFTHFGISGPLVLSASAHMQKYKPSEYEITIDLKPALSHEQLDARLQRELKSNKNFSNILRSLLPAKLCGTIASKSGISFELKGNQITKQMRNRLCEILKKFTLNATKFRPIEEAIITSGGVDVSEINPKTMESKIQPGILFVGEILDVDAYTGGYNLQIAWSTGYVAGINA